MKREGLSEAEVFSLIQRKSMDMRKPMGGDCPGDYCLSGSHEGTA